MQVIDFTREIAKAGPDDKAIIAGNSIGALAALYAAAEGQEQCQGLCLINAAGNFEPGAPPGPEKNTAAQKAMGMVDTSADAEEKPTLRQRLGEFVGRTTATGIFYFTKIRIKQILQQVTGAACVTVICSYQCPAMKSIIDAVVITERRRGTYSN